MLVSGMFLIILSLGFGLVHIPRKIWRKRTNELTLKYYQFTVWQLEDKRIKLIYETEDQAKLLYSMAQEEVEGVTMNEKTLIYSILDKIPQSMQERFSSSISEGVLPEMLSSVKFSKSWLVFTNRRVMMSVSEFHRLEYSIKTTCESAYYLEDIIDSINKNLGYIRSSFESDKTGFCQAVYGKISKPPQNGSFDA